MAATFTPGSNLCRGDWHLMHRTEKEMADQFSDAKITLQALCLEETGLSWIAKSF